MWKHKSWGIVIAMVFLVCAGAFASGTNEGSKKITLNVLSQPRREWEYLEKFLSEFKAKEGIDVKISYFAENERRSKSRLDASTKAGQFQVYYIDEANVAEFALNNWLVPIKSYYPAEYDFDDFSKPLVNVLTMKGVAYGAPISFEGSMIFYRKDLFEKDGIAVPKTLDEYLAAVKHFQNPPDLYGTGTRGLRGSGMNVWRFSPYLIRFGGKWLDDAGNPVFNSPEAVKAVQYYIELIKNSPGPTMSWSDVMDNFAAGKEAIVEFANLKADYILDPKDSKVVDKVGFAAPANSLSNIAVHGLAISAAGCPSEDLRKAAGKFIGWWTSKEEFDPAGEERERTDKRSSLHLRKPRVCCRLPAGLRQGTAGDDERPANVHSPDSAVAGNRRLLWRQAGRAVHQGLQRSGIRYSGRPR